MTLELPQPTFPTNNPHNKSTLSFSAKTDHFFLMCTQRSLLYQRRDPSQGLRLTCHQRNQKPILFSFPFLSFSFFKKNKFEFSKKKRLPKLLYTKESRASQMKTLKSPGVTSIALAVVVWLNFSFLLFFEIPI